MLGLFGVGRVSTAHIQFVSSLTCRDHSRLSCLSERMGCPTDVDVTLPGDCVRVPVWTDLIPDDLEKLLFQGEKFSCENINLQRFFGELDRAYVTICDADFSLSFTDNLSHCLRRFNDIVDCSIKDLTGDKYNARAGIENNVIAQWRHDNSCRVDFSSSSQSLTLSMNFIFPPHLARGITQHTFVKFRVLKALTNMKQPKIHLGPLMWVFEVLSDGQGVVSCLLVHINDCRGMIVCDFLLLLC